MPSTIELTNPLDAATLRTVYPRDLRAMEDGELAALLRLEERALRSQFGVTGTDAATDTVLLDAMLAAWPSFLQQVRQVAQEQAGADSFQVTYNRAGVIDFVFPAFLGAMLASASDPDDVPPGVPVTQLTR